MPHTADASFPTWYPGDLHQRIELTLFKCLVDFILMWVGLLLTNRPSNEVAAGVHSSQAASKTVKLLQTELPAPDGSLLELRS